MQSLVLSRTVALILFNADHCRYRFIYDVQTTGHMQYPKYYHELELTI